MKVIYKILILLFVTAIIIGSGVYWYAFMRPYQNMLKAKPEFELSATNLFSEFNENETNANAKYLGKVIEITGRVVELKTTNDQLAIVLEDELFGVRTFIDSSFYSTNKQIFESINPGTSVTIRGQCDGMLNDVIISRAVIIR